MSKNIIVTGSAKGIGLACAKLFLEKGYQVIGLDNDAIAINELIKSNIGIDYICCDISNSKDILKVCKEIISKYQKIDILINNAAIQINDNFEEYTYENWSKVMNTNYFGACNCISSFIKYMPKDSTVLNILSVHSNKPRKNRNAYDSSKSALEMLTKELALEFADKGITINALSFGAVNTNMNKSWEKNPTEKQEALSKVPMKIIFEDKNIAHFAYVITSEFSKYTTGSIFIVDGGRSLI